MCAITTYVYRVLHDYHLRNDKNFVCDAENVAFLQQVFVEMDETDGVYGVIAASGAEPTPETQLKLLESTGALQVCVILLSLH